MMARWLFRLGAVVSLSVACSSPTSQASVEDARFAWELSGIEDYLVVVTQTGQALDGCRWVTEVHGNDVNSRWSSMVDVECGERDVSVPALHEELAEQTADSEADGGNFSVSWDEAGVPRTIVLDLGSSDGEPVSLNVEFRDLSAEGGDLSVRAALADARRCWAEAGISGYRLEVSESRNYWRQGCTWVTAVADGVVRDASVDSPSDSQACFGVEWTVEELHDRIAEWADSIEEFSDPEFGEHTLEVVFDELGVPETIRFDLANADDEESTLRVIFREQG